MVAAGDVEVAEGLSVGGALSVAALAPTEIVAPGTAGGALTLRSAGAQSSGEARGGPTSARPRRKGTRPAAKQTAAKAVAAITR